MKTLPCIITTLTLFTGAFAPLHSYAADDTESMADPAAEKTLAPYFQVLGAEAKPTDFQRPHSESSEKVD